MSRRKQREAAKQAALAELNAELRRIAREGVKARKERELNDLAEALAEAERRGAARALGEAAMAMEQACYAIARDPHSDRDAYMLGRMAGLSFAFDLLSERCLSAHAVREGSDTPEQR